MVDVPRRDPLQDPTNPEHQAKRLRILANGMTPRGDRGASRWAQPVGTVDRQRAGARSIGGTIASPAEIRFKNDQFTVTDAATDTFALTHPPIFESWNVDMGWPWTDGLEYEISGQTVTVLDPAGTFRGIADNGSRLLQVEYAYRKGYAFTPSPFTEPEVVGVPWFQYGSNNVKCWWRMEGMAGVDIANDLGAQFHDTINAYEGSTFGNLSTGPQLAGGSYGPNIYYGDLTRPWYGTAIMDGLQVSVPYFAAPIFDLPSPVSQHTGAPPTSYQG